MLRTANRMYAGGFTNETAAPEVLGAWVLEKRYRMNQRTISGGATATGAVDDVAREVPGIWHNMMKADMWSVGIILLQLPGGSLPWSFSNYGDEVVEVEESVAAIHLYSNPEVIIRPQYPYGCHLHCTTHPHILGTYHV